MTMRFEAIVYLLAVNSSWIPASIETLTQSKIMAIVSEKRGEKLINCSISEMVAITLQWESVVHDSKSKQVIILAYFEPLQSLAHLFLQTCLLNRSSVVL